MDVYENVSKAANVWWSPVVPSSQLDHLASQNPAGAGHVVHDRFSPMQVRRIREQGMIRCLVLQALSNRATSEVVCSLL